MAHQPCRPAHPDWSLGDDDRKPPRSPAGVFAEWADRKYVVIGTHVAAPTAGRVVHDGAAFSFTI